MSAVISDCGKYRYRLDREVQSEGKVFAYFGINPSTADASIDDPTVRKWRGFTLRNGGRKFIVGNVFAYRSTDPKALGLLSIADACGPDQMFHLLEILGEADVLVPCWGNFSKVPKTHQPIIQQMLGIIHMIGGSSNRPVLHFGLTESGAPKHPLMLGYDTPLLPLPEVR
jgi:hypothetical protein